MNSIQAFVPFFRFYFFLISAQKFNVLNMLIFWLPHKLAISNAEIWRRGAERSLSLIRLKQLIAVCNLRSEYMSAKF